LVAVGRIELRNFGVCEVKKRTARNARNPRTGDKVKVPEKYVVTFKPGKEMEARVREMEIRAGQLGATLKEDTPVDPAETSFSASALEPGSSRENNL
ncbi:MAG: integration host factor subunit beta, partial [Planctomycetaceae bacterium]|nr:integration host factor subunit beta [Planctomycetaceae bacterium]